MKSVIQSGECVKALSGSEGCRGSDAELLAVIASVMINFVALGSLARPRNASLSLWMAVREGRAPLRQELLLIF